MTTVFLFDLDGTITCNELLPLIGREIGLYDELVKLTDDTMQGKIPFDQSFKKRVSMLSQSPLADIQEIILNAPCFEELLNWIKSNREECYIVTGNLDLWIQPWMTKHKIRGFTSESEISGDSYEVSKILRKESVLQNFVNKRTVMIGDGANDARIMELSDIGIANLLS